MTQSDSARSNERVEQALQCLSAAPELLENLVANFQHLTIRDPDDRELTEQEVHDAQTLLRKAIDVLYETDGHPTAEQTQEIVGSLSTIAQNLEAIMGVVRGMVGDGLMEQPVSKQAMENITDALEALTNALNTLDPHLSYCKNERQIVASNIRNHRSVVRHRQQGILKGPRMRNRFTGTPGSGGFVDLIA
ncbi:hypothetical protein HY213_02570 [Candidatus Peregrinibacteria bacterium]|nr:hypothetical protein [Candidatus Peregrinibacteria bacterium]